MLRDPIARSSYRNSQQDGCSFCLISCHQPGMLHDPIARSKKTLERGFLFSA
jgi:hypothetical protein